MLTPIHGLKMESFLVSCPFPLKDPPFIPAHFFSFDYRSLCPLEALALMAPLRFHCYSSLCSFSFFSMEILYQIYTLSFILIFLLFDHFHIPIEKIYNLFKIQLFKFSVLVSSSWLQLEKNTELHWLNLFVVCEHNITWAFTLVREVTPCLFSPKYLLHLFSNAVL